MDPQQGFLHERGIMEPFGFHVLNKIITQVSEYADSYLQ